jgi:hypothetical protein
MAFEVRQAPRVDGALQGRRFTLRGRTGRRRRRRKRRRGRRRILFRKRSLPPRCFFF